MTKKQTRYIQSKYELNACIRALELVDLPVTVSWLEGKRRSLAQNRLQAKWIEEIAAHFGDRTSEEVRCEIKLRFGVPIRRRDCVRYKAKYDDAIKPLTYEQKLDIMGEPINLPVTRDMTTAQKAEFLDTVQRHYLQQGVQLSDPEALKYEV